MKQKDGGRRRKMIMKRTKRREKRESEKVYVCVYQDLVNPDLDTG